MSPPVRVTYADGTTEVRRASSFSKKGKRSKRRQPVSAIESAPASIVAPGTSSAGGTSTPASARRRTNPSERISASYRVTVERHVVARWLIAPTTAIVPAVSAEDARTFVVGIALRRAGCPPWKPLVTRSLIFATATRTDALPRVTVKADDSQQLRIAA